MSDFISYLKDIYVEGQRYIVFNALVGTMAKWSIPRDVAYEIYSYIRHNDDEDRSHIIERTYEKVSEGNKVVTLYSLKDIEEYNKLFEYAKIYFKRYSTLKQKVEIDDIEKKLNINTHLKDEIFDLDLISNKIDKYKTPVSYNYLISRSITEDNINKYDIRVGKGKLKEYIIFPVKENNVCVYYVARNYVNGMPRYKNASKDKSKYIWFSCNNDVVNKSDTIIICEGIINAITIYNYTGLLTCAVFGKYISKMQYLKLQKYDNIILSFDNDVSEEFLFKKIIPNFRNKHISIIKYPKNVDANDLSRKEFLKLFFNREQIDDVDLLIKI